MNTHSYSREIAGNLGFILSSGSGYGSGYQLLGNAYITETRPAAFSRPKTSSETVGQGVAASGKWLKWHGG